MKHFTFLSESTTRFVMLWLGVSVCYAAQAANSAAPLSLLDAYQLAQGHDAQIASALAERDAGREKLPQGRAGLLPQVSLEVNYYDYNQETSYNRLTPTLSTTDLDYRYDSSSYSISLTQPLYRLQNLAVYRQAQSQVSIAEDTFVIAEQNLILRLADAYFNVLIAEESLVAAQSQTSATARSLEEATAKFEVGTVTKADVDEAQAGYDLARANEIVTHNELQVNKQTLAKIIGQTPEKLRGASELIVTPLQPENMQKWEQTALQHSPVIRVAQNQLAVAQQEVARNRGERYPSVDLVASYTDSTYDGADLTGAGYDSDTAMIGVQLQIPLYSGGSLSSSMREATANRIKSQQDLRESHEQVKLDTRQAYLTVTSGRLQVQAYQQAVKSSESALQTTQRGYEVGLRTSLDVLNSQQQLFENRRNLANAKYNYLNSLLQLKAAVGVLAMSDVEDINRLLTQ